MFKEDLRVIDYRENLGFLSCRNNEMEYESRNRDRGNYTTETFLENNDTPR